MSKHAKRSATIAYFPGTFDPVTRGHVDLVRRGVDLFGGVIVGVVLDHGAPLFAGARRVALMEAVLQAQGLLGRGAEVEGFRGLAVEAARARGAGALLRGVRGVRDWEYELTMAHANRSLAPEIDTVVLPPSTGVAEISGTLVREVSRLGGDVSGWVHPLVAQALAERWSGAAGQDEGGTER